MYEGAYKSGKKHGQGKLFYENGKMRYSGNFLDGEIEGENLVWFNEWDGVKFRGNIIGGKETGWCKRYHDNGKSMLRGFFVEGEVEGDSVAEYYWNGNVKRMGQVYFDSEGRVTSAEELDKAGEEEEGGNMLGMLGIAKLSEGQKSGLVGLLGGGMEDDEGDEEDDEEEEGMVEEGEDLDDDFEIDEEDDEEEDEEEEEENDEEEGMMEEGGDEVMNLDKDDDGLTYQEKIGALMSIQAMGFDISSELEKLNGEKAGKGNGGCFAVPKKPEQKVCKN